MSLFRTAQSNGWKLGNLQLRSKRAQLFVVAGMFLLYILTYRSNIEALGYVGEALVSFPVLAAGWYFGRMGGLLAAMAAIIINPALTAGYFNGHMWAEMGRGWPGNILLLTVGYGAGALRIRSERQSEVETKLRNRERYFSFVNRAVQDILAYKQSEELYFRLVTLLTNLFVADYGFLLRCAPEKKQPLILASTIYTDLSQPVRLNSSDADWCASILESGQALYLNINVENRSSLPKFLNDQTPEAQSLLCIPLKLTEFTFGAALLAFTASRNFSEEEMHQAGEAGRQIALALWTTQQESEIQKRLKEAQTLANISRSLSETEQVGLDHVLQRIVNSARELIPGTQQAVIHLLDEESGMLLPKAVSGFKNPHTGELRMRLGDGVAGQVLDSGEVVSISDVETDARFLSQTQPIRFHSLIVAPVESGGKRLGTISVQSVERGAFHAEQQALLQSLGIHAAIAIQNAHLFQTIQEGLKEINALYHITQGLSASLETEQLMKDVVNLLQQNFGYYLAEIFVVDSQTDDLVVKHASGKNGDLLIEKHLRAGAGIVGHAAETGEAFFTNAVDQVLFYYPHPLLPDTQSELAVPIKVEGRVVGVLDVQQRPPARLTERDQQLVTTVAEQLAIALQKAELYSDLQTALEQEKAVRSQLVQSERLALVGRLLASVSHELNNPLQAIQNALFLLEEERGISEQGRQDLQIVISEAERMAALIDRLRTSYRPARQQDFQPIQMNTIIEDIHALVATHLRHNQIAFEFHPDPNLPAIWGLSDQMRQVVLNLLMNAAEAMPNGGRLTVTTERANEQEVAVSISDTGPGIAPEMLPHIFDAFVTNKEGGTGLGLTITYDIIHRHHGRITAQNAPEGGAAFTFWIPISSQESA